jgi:hypothetical protein
MLTNFLNLFCVFVTSNQLLSQLVVLVKHPCPSCTQAQSTIDLTDLVANPNSKISLSSFVVGEVPIGCLAPRKIDMRTDG